jgi:hypothetical protein
MHVAQLQPMLYGSVKKSSEFIFAVSEELRGNEIPHRFHPEAIELIHVQARQLSMYMKCITNLILDLARQPYDSFTLVATMQPYWQIP